MILANTSKCLRVQIRQVKITNLNYGGLMRAEEGVVEAGSIVDHSKKEHGGQEHGGQEQGSGTDDDCHCRSGKQGKMVQEVGS